MERLKKKYDTARGLVPKPIIDKTAGARVGIITYGSSIPAVEEARFMMKKAVKLKTDLLRLRALPCTPEVQEFINKYDRLYIVEANRDGQLCQILSAVFPQQASRFRPACHSDGLPLTASWVRDAILAREEKS